MQLKRDTDYALRIILCIGESWLDSRADPDGLSLSEISLHTGVPKISVNRICGNLKDRMILSSGRTTEKSVSFYPCPAFFRLSLLDIIEASEDNVNLFALFDRTNRLYSAQTERLQRVQNDIESILSGTTVEDLLGEKKKRRKKLASRW